ncbi:MAG: hypothetical protein IJE14_07150 [Clostridia bacterium]|nr:hypothetical protein [Clostridia bacterium]
MVNVNIVFDDVFDDADIIAVPAEIAPKIEEIGQEFLEWLSATKESDYSTIIKGQHYVVAETDGFIKWLNAYHCKGSEKTRIIAQNTNYNPELKTIQF